MSIRRITLDDLPDCFEIARSCYGTFDEVAMWKWAVTAIHLPNVIAVRDDDAFGLAMVAGVEWEPNEKHGMQRYIAVRNKASWQAVKLMRFMAKFCTEALGAVDYQFGEVTGMRMDIIAKRIGAKPNSPTYTFKKGE